MVPENSGEMSRKHRLTLQSTNRLMTKSRLDSKSKSNIISSTSLSQPSKRNTNLKHTRDQHQHQQRHVSGQEEEIDQEWDIIGTLTFENARLEEKIMGLEERVRELKMQRESDVRMLLWMRVEVARFGEWWRWVERGRGEGIQENERC